MRTIVCYDFKSAMSYQPFYFFKTGVNGIAFLHKRFMFVHDIDNRLTKTALHIANHKLAIIPNFA